MNSSDHPESAAPALADVLFAKGEVPLYAVLDGASAPDLVKNLYEHEPEYCCLYRGELPPDIATVAPYLVRLEHDDKFTQWVLAEGWGAHWGIFAISTASLRALRDHFRQFHSVELPDQQTVLFRYYDPRVLRTFLPACNPAELSAFFGPIQSFIVEDDPAGTGLKFSFTSKGLNSQPLQLKKTEAAVAT